MAVLLTGASGFFGNYLKRALADQDLTTLGLSGCDYNVDLSCSMPEFRNSFTKVVHSAGLAHLSLKSKPTEQRFFDVNVTGTSNLLKGLEKLPRLPDFFIFISTVAIYGVEKGAGIDETVPLTGNSPYALSKAKAETDVENWGARNNVRILILRLPLIVGKNPPGSLGAMIKSIKKGYYFRIGDGSARRSMVLAEDVAGFIASFKGPSGTFNLTDGCHPTIKELDEAIASRLNRRVKKIPASLVKLAARTGDFLPFLPINSIKFKKLTLSLTFSDAKARREIGWQSRPVVDNLVI